MTDFDQIVQDWRTNGGDQMRKEFMDALATGQALSSETRSFLRPRPFQDSPSPP
jgi:hypothetical protein